MKIGYIPPEIREALDACDAIWQEADKAFMRGEISLGEVREICCALGEEKAKICEEWDEIVRTV